MFPVFFHSMICMAICEELICIPGMILIVDSTEPRVPFENSENVTSKFPAVPPRIAPLVKTKENTQEKTHRNNVTLINLELKVRACTCLCVSASACLRVSVCTCG